MGDPARREGVRGRRLRKSTRRDVGFSRVSITTRHASCFQRCEQLTDVDALVPDDEEVPSRHARIITRGDILRLYARSDETIGAAVRDSLRAADGIVGEGVERGVVTLAGTAASQAMADAVIRIAEAVDGVVAVDADRLEWSESPQVIAPIP